MTDRTMRSVSQQNPSDRDNVFGQFFRRGPEVAADGGKRTGDERADGTPVDSDDGTPVDSDDGTMKHVDQTPPDETEPNRVWERGNESVAESEDE